MGEKIVIFGHLLLNKFLLIRYLRNSLRHIKT